MTAGADADVYVRFREMNRFARVTNMGAFWPNRNGCFQVSNGDKQRSAHDGS
jgi:hypothetical protein